MENTNNAIAVDCHGFDLFQSDDEHPRSFFEINIRTFFRFPRVSPQFFEQPMGKFKAEINYEIVSLPSWFESFLKTMFAWIDMKEVYNLESSAIDILASEVSDYTRNRVIPRLHSMGANSFRLIADLIAIRDWDGEEEMLPVNDTEGGEEEEEEEIEMEWGSGVPEFALERLRKSSFPYEEKEQGGSSPMRKIGVGDECSICLQEFGDSMNVSKLITCLPCSHIFHQECIFRWLQERNSCPYCRSRVE